MKSESAPETDVNVIVDTTLGFQEIELELSKAEEDPRRRRQLCLEPDVNINDIIGIAKSDDVLRIESAHRHRRRSVLAKQIAQSAANRDREDVLVLDIQG